MSIVKSTQKWSFGLMMISAMFFAGTSFAASDVVLTVANLITNETYELTDDDLSSLEQVTVNTKNEFVDDVATFMGPLARDVLVLLLTNEDTGSDDTAITLLGNSDFETVTLLAANDYAIDVPLDDFLNFNVIFATSQDGIKFSLRDKGPIWVIYPMTDNPELQDRVYNDRLIWQLVKVSVK
ncbi:MAG: hypothetical protein V3V13_12910 [Paracoccaceae bacterium]